MPEKSKITGISIGILLTITLFSWFSYKHYLNTYENRIPIKVKQDLMKLQKHLPIKLSKELNLENYAISRNSIDVVIRVTKDLRSNISKKILEHKINLSMCQWRNDFLENNKITIKMKLLDKYSSELASIKNTTKTCENISDLVQEITL